MMMMMGNWYVSSVVFDEADDPGLQRSCEEEEIVIWFRWTTIDAVTTL